MLLEVDYCPADSLSQVAASVASVQAQDIKYCFEDPAAERLHDAVQVCWAY